MSLLVDDPRLSENAFFPRRDTRPGPAGSTDATIAAADGTALHARTYAAEGAKVTLLLFHGNGEVVADYDSLATSYAAAGARLVVVDFRGYGRSAGIPTVRATLADAPVVFDHVARSVRGPLVVMGRSLGSMCAAELMRTRAEAAAGFVLESGFTDVLAFVRRRGLTHAGLGEEDRALLCPLAKVASSTKPLLVLHGERDTLIVPSEGRAAFEASPAKDKALTIVPDRGHNDVSLHPVYWTALAAFVARVAEGSERAEAP